VALWAQRCVHCARVTSKSKYFEVAAMKTTKNALLPVTKAPCSVPDPHATFIINIIVVVPLASFVVVNPLVVHCHPAPGLLLCALSVDLSGARHQALVLLWTCLTKALGSFDGSSRATTAGTVMASSRRRNLSSICTQEAPPEANGAPLSAVAVCPRGQCGIFQVLGTSQGS